MRTAVDVVFVNDLPPAYIVLARRVASVIVRGGGFAGERHGLYLALAGALLRRRVPPEHVPSMVCEIAALAGAEDPHHHRESAIDTVQRWAAGFSVKGSSGLPIAVVDALDEAAEEQRVEPTAPTAADAHESIVQAVRSAPAGLSLVHAQCGIGKTQAAIRVAAERARVEHATPGPHTRAPTQSKTAISVPTTELAEQIAEQLRAGGTPTLRLFGPLSMRRTDGSPECQYHEVARHLADGGQSIPWELCLGRDRSPCEHAHTCRAFEGADGPRDARVAVGPHGLLKRLDGHAGATGLLVIDEPPSFLSSGSFTLDELKSAFEELDSFESRYAAALAPVLDAVIAWLSAAPVDEAIKVPDIFSTTPPKEALERDAFSATGASTIGDAVRSAFEPEHRGPKSPPLRRMRVDMAKRSAAIAAKLGRSSRILWSLYRGMTEPEQVAIRVEERTKQGDEKERILVVTESDEDLKQAVTRSGACIALDANADLHESVLKKIAGLDKLDVVRAFAADPIEVTRIHIPTKASRSGWLDLNRLRDPKVFTSALRYATDKLLGAGAKRVAIVTMRLVEIAFRAALGEDTSSAWRDAGQTPALLAEVRAELSPIFARYPTRPELGHYGALRGLNKWKDFDALMTFGDPWPNLGELRHEVAFLGLAEDGDDRARAFCRAELEQAHGRLRVPHRTASCVQVHVGRIRPGGWTDPIEVAPLCDSGRPRAVETITPDEVRSLAAKLGSVAAAARALDIPRTRLRSYADGTATMPADLAERLRSLAGDDPSDGPNH